MLPVFSLFADFPFVGVHLSIDIYAILTFELRHYLFFGAGKRVQECISSMIEGEERHSPVVAYYNGSQKTFKAIKILILSTFKIFLEKTEESSAVYGMKLDFLKANCFYRLSSLFNDHPLHDMLRAAEFNAMNSLLAFTSKIVEMFCGTGKNANVTRTQTWYLKMVNCVFWQYELIPCSEALKMLQNYI